MTQKEIIEGNKLIAKFMNYKGVTRNGKFFDHDKDGNFHQYDSSWDWLMPVLEKINSLYKTEMNEFKLKEYTYQVNKIKRISIISPIKVGWSCVIDFIKWYNSQLK